MRKAAAVAQPPRPLHPQSEFGAFLELCVYHADPLTTVFTRPLPPLAVAGYAMLTRFQVDDFEIVTVLGRGSTGKTLKTTHKPSNKVYVLKCVECRDIRENISRSEISSSVLLSGRQLPRSSTILPTLDVVFHAADVSPSSNSDTVSSSATKQDEENGISHPERRKAKEERKRKDKEFSVVREFREGGELAFHLAKLTTFALETVRFYSAQIGIALDLLQPLLRREIKPERVLLDRDGYCSVIPPLFSDDNQAFVPPNPTHCFVATPEYLAPEVLKGDATNYKSVWWSFGCLIFEMACGIPPFYSENINQMYEAILLQELSFPDNLNDAVEFQDLVRRLLDRDPNKRMCDLLSFKAHPFFRGFDWCALAERRMPCPKEISKVLDSCTSGGPFVPVSGRDEFSGNPPPGQFSDFKIFAYQQQ